MEKRVDLHMLPWCLMMELGSVFPSWPSNRFRFSFIYVLPVFLVTIYFFLASQYVVITFSAVLADMVNLLYWVITMVMFYAICAHFLSKVVPRFSDRISALVPAIIYLALTDILISAVIGVVNWGEPMNFSLLRYSLPDVFNTAKALSLPAIYPIAALTLPPVLLIAILQCMRIRWKAPAHGEDQLKGSIAQSKIIFVAVWISFGLVRCWVFDNIVPNASMASIFAFFSNSSQTFELNDRRKQAIYLDSIARKSLPKQNPRINNVILFIVDALRADHLSLYGYKVMTDPFLCSLAKEMHFYRV